MDPREAILLLKGTGTDLIFLQVLLREQNVELTRLAELVIPTSTPASRRHYAAKIYSELTDQERTDALSSLLSSGLDDQHWERHLRRPPTDDATIKRIQADLQAEQAKANMLVTSADEKSTHTVRAIEFIGQSKTTGVVSIKTDSMTEPMDVIHDLVSLWATARKCGVSVLVNTWLPAVCIECGGEWSIHPQMNICKQCGYQIYKTQDGITEEA